MPLYLTEEESVKLEWYSPKTLLNRLCCCYQPTPSSFLWYLALLFSCSVFSDLFLDGRYRESSTSEREEPVWMVNASLYLDKDEAVQESGKTEAARTRWRDAGTQTVNHCAARIRWKDSLPRRPQHRSVSVHRKGTDFYCSCRLYL